VDRTPQDEVRTGEAYETPELSDYGTIEEWTRGTTSAAPIVISIII
jgi:hypothetical protein